ncbi:MAG: CAP domain-containing protein [Chloroflexota bacterium]|nr:CAP domain-containing protein [Chloroflexota bacterium]
MFPEKCNKLPQFVLCLSILFLLFGLISNPSQAQGNEAYELIANVNALRKANGLPPYKINAALMSAAQAHSDYQASIGSITHTGAGGSRPSDRVKAAGYGGGARVFVSENIAGGYSVTAQRAVAMWQGDAPHLNTMLSPNYVDVGAGVAYDGKSTYFTLDAAYISGQAGTGPVTSPGTGAHSGTSPTKIVLFVSPIIVATPAPDGSVIHVVEYGQFLINIAKAYEKKLNEILALNGLKDTSTIYIGDKILIEPPAPTLSSAPTRTNSAAPPTATTIRTPASSGSREAALIEITSEIPSQLSPTEPSGNQEQQGFQNGKLILIGIGALVAVGTLLIVVGIAIKQRPDEIPPD